MRRADSSNSRNSNMELDNNKSEIFNTGIDLGTWPDWVMLLFTGFLAWLSWRQHKLEARLANDTVDSINLARQSADAAREATDVARNTMRITYRPAFYLSQVVMEVQDSRPLDGKLLYLNEGFASAENTKGNIVIVVGSQLPQRNPIDVPNPANKFPINTVPMAGLGWWKINDERKLSKQELTDIKSGKTNLYLVGRIVYDHEVMSQTMTSHALFTFKYNPATDRHDLIRDDPTYIFGWKGTQA